MYDIAVGTIQAGECGGLWRKLGEWIDWAGELDYPEDAIDSTLSTGLGNGLKRGERLIRDGKQTL